MIDDPAPNQRRYLIDLARHGVAMALGIESTAPITSEEFGFSLLSPMVKTDQLDETEPGSDGLYVKSGRGTGVLLPRVATEYG